MSSGVSNSSKAEPTETYVSSSESSCLRLMMKYATSETVYEMQKNLSQKIYCNMQRIERSQEKLCWLSVSRSHSNVRAWNETVLSSRSVMEEDVRAALLDRYYKDSEFIQPPGFCFWSPRLGNLSFTNYLPSSCHHAGLPERLAGAVSPGREPACQGAWQRLLCRRTLVLLTGIQVPARSDIVCTWGHEWRQFLKHTR